MKSPAVSASRRANTIGAATEEKKTMEPASRAAARKPAIASALTARPPAGQRATDRNGARQSSSPGTSVLPLNSTRRRSTSCCALTSVVTSYWMPR